MRSMKRVRVTLRGKLVAEVDVDKPLTVGRKAPADVVVADTEISGKHLRLRPDGDRLLATDLGSTNGTAIEGGAKLAPDTEFPLERGQRLLLGPAVLEVLEEAPKQAEEAAFAATDKTVAIGSGALQTALVNVARFKAAQARLVVAAEHDRRTVPIEEMEVTVGRDPAQAKVVITHQSVSARHAAIRFENGRFLLEDLKSVNGTFVDDRPVAVATPIESDLALRFGTVDCLFVHRAPETTAGAEADRGTEALVEHAVRMGKATPQQAKEVLAEHRASKKPLGQVFVERGILSPKEWSEIHRNRQVIATLGGLAPARRASVSKVVGIVVVVLGLAALAIVFLANKG
jgi:pSer/pThr/pTyr-binding forkhead associated (FHA) protein